MSDFTELNTHELNEIDGGVFLITASKLALSLGLGIAAGNMVNNIRSCRCGCACNGRGCGC